MLSRVSRFCITIAAINSTNHQSFITAAAEMEHLLTRQMSSLRMFTSVTIWRQALWVKQMFGGLSSSCPVILAGK